MKILVLGAEGMLGRGLASALADRHSVVAAGRSQGDVCSLGEMQNLFSSVNPDLVFHCAAYTDVDGAENDPDRAFRVNALGTRNVAQCCEEARAVLVYMSSEFVFDGKSCRPYCEHDETNPLNVYGASKLEGEWYASRLCRRFLIVRTSRLFGPGGRNFVSAMLDKLRRGEELKVVADQVSTPTFTGHLVRVLVRMVERGVLGIYHVTAQGRCSWYEFARRLVEQRGLKDVRITAIRSCEEASAAPRPHFSVLDNRNLRLDGFEALPHWHDGLAALLGD